MPIIASVEDDPDAKKVKLVAYQFFDTLATAAMKLAEKHGKTMTRTQFISAVSGAASRFVSECVVAAVDNESDMLDVIRSVNDEIRTQCCDLWVKDHANC